MYRIAVYTSFPEMLSTAQTLAEHLQLPLSTTPESARFLLLLTPDYLGLQQTGSLAHPLYVDFLSKKMRYRQQQASLRREALARALGLKNNTHPRIIDATAGLARDSFILASLGFEVTLLERSPIIYELLKNGIERAKQDTDMAAIISKLSLVQTNAIDWLKNSPPADMIYLDPMFPERKKSAQVKKEMTLFQEVIGEDTDSDELLKTALRCTKQRVAVKRPLHAQPLANLSPNFSIKGRSSRFDVYIPM